MPLIALKNIYTYIYIYEFWGVYILIYAPVPAVLL